MHQVICGCVHRNVLDRAWWQKNWYAMNGQFDMCFRLNSKHMLVGIANYDPKTQSRESLGLECVQSAGSYKYA